MFKKFIIDYLSFTRKERTGIVVILLLIVMFIMLPFLYPLFIAPKPTDHSAFEKEIASLKIKQADSSDQFERQSRYEGKYRHYYPSYEKNYNDKPTGGELFSFDPNTLPDEGWKKLGIRDKTIATIRNYLSKGGKFYKPEDIGKIWGLHEDEMQRLLPYISIPERVNSSAAEKKNTDIKSYVKKEYAITAFDINTADTSAFIALRGIGSKLANRIIAFREKLGGFYKVEQVAETFALPDSVFQKIKISLIITNTTVKKININTATVDELKTHPYIRYTLANAIVQYRTQHGSFTAITDLKKIMILTEENYNKLAPYLTIQ
jgi:competence protein ComEA